MSTQEITSSKNQYTLRQILGIWSLAAIPMGILSWVVYPAVARGFEADPLGSGVAFRAYYMLVTVAAVAFVCFLNSWNWLGWRY